MASSFCINQEAKSSAKSVDSREPRRGLEDSSENLKIAVRRGSINLSRTSKRITRAC